ncbi:hypothetical protein K503DRAFT_837360 [Rhizopogon vinicolor AM-OR11-026]|uniref:Transmembrane protein n=1 Tax=Rhizopogon vinicolor AM-OR11-026 TaxID=1314800 RepID=A0A1B7MLY9_9AGAM|nr:hypothetical protein K503DRAFT_837360 [Rhizopogon vinicolor AM-OR11-026]
MVYPFSSLTGIDHVISPGAVRSRRVPSVGGYDGHRDDVIILLIGFFTGVVFGGMHCLGWNFLFRRHAEQTLWRASSLAIMCGPVIFFLSFWYYKLWSKRSRSELASVDTTFLFFLLIATLITFVLYIVARVSVLLIVLMVLSLLSMPPGVYDTVSWTKFIPHL